jgi:hypothetical protein
MQIVNLFILALASVVLAVPVAMEETSQTVDGVSCDLEERGINRRCIGFIVITTMEIIYYR